MPSSAVLISERPGATIATFNRLGGGTTTCAMLSAANLSSRRLVTWITALRGCSKGTNTTFDGPGIKSLVDSLISAAGTSVAWMPTTRESTDTCMSHFTGSLLKFSSATNTCTEVGRSYGRSTEIAAIDTLSASVEPIAW